MRPNLSNQIPALHSVYRSLTGYRIVMNMYRERQWYEWLNWNQDTPFNIADLIIVIRYLRDKIGSGDRNVGSLKFHNLISSPDHFEEDLSLARQHYRPRPEAAPRALRTTTADGVTTERRIPNPGTEDTSKPVSETALKLLREFKNKLKPMSER